MYLRELAMGIFEERRFQKKNNPGSGPGIGDIVRMAEGGSGEEASSRR